MPSLLPAGFLFRYSFAVRHATRLPKSGSQLLGLSAEHALPDVGKLDDAHSFGELRLAWHEQGIGISVEAKGKQQQPRGAVESPDFCDGLHVWIDTRNTQNIHRASKFCHYFCLFPRGGGPGGKEPVALQRGIDRAREEAPRCNPGDIRLKAEITKSGYLLEAWLPAKVLHGYDPEAQPRLGFYYCLHDEELGEQFLSVGREFPFPFDPSLWATLELAR